MPSGHLGSRRPRRALALRDRPQQCARHDGHRPRHSPPHRGTESPCGGRSAPGSGLGTALRSSPRQRLAHRASGGEEARRRPACRPRPRPRGNKSRGYPTVLAKRLCIALGAELVQQARRALDVGEEEGDGPTRKIRHLPRLRCKSHNGASVQVLRRPRATGGRDRSPSEVPHP